MIQIKNRLTNKFIKLSKDSSLCFLRGNPVKIEYDIMEDNEFFFKR